MVLARASRIKVELDIGKEHFEEDRLKKDEMSINGKWRHPGKERRPGEGGGRETRPGNKSPGLPEKRWRRNGVHSTKATLASWCFFDDLSEENHERVAGVERWGCGRLQEDQ